MATKSPVFPICEPQHFSDYGFDPQFDYFQVLEEAKRHHKKEREAAANFKLQKPISKTEQKIKKKKQWWKNPLLLFFSRSSSRSNSGVSDHHDDDVLGGYGGRCIRGSLSGPIYYVTESSSSSRSSGSSTPYHLTTSRPSSGPLAGTLSPVEKGEIQIPYISLREFDMDHHRHHHHRFSTSAMPIYLVT